MADDREAWRKRLDAMLDQLAAVSAERDALKMRAELAEENASYAELQLIACREGSE